MKRALLIGITEYQVFTITDDGNNALPKSDYWPHLEGAVHDIETYKGIFQALGFQIETLINAQAPGEAIIKGFTKIVSETTVKVFYDLLA